MELLNALGVNSTVFVQFAVFLVTYVIVSKILFWPYFRAFEMRTQLTVGRSAEAEKIQAETANLQTEYETVAKDLSSKIRTVYEAKRKAAQRDSDALIQTARQESKATLDSFRAQLKAQDLELRAQLDKQVQGVAATISSKLLGRDFSL